MNIKKLKKVLLSLTLIITASFIYAKSTHSQGANIELSPAKSNITIEPGTVYNQTFRVGNYSGEKTTLYFYVQDFTVTNESGTPTYYDVDSEGQRFALSQWIELPYEQVEIDNNEIVEIETIIDVPEDAEAGGHYGAFIVQTEPPQQEGTAIGSVARIAALILVNVPGDVEERIIITDAYTDKGVYYEENPEVEFVTFLKNEGNVHGIPFGAFTITGGKGFKTKSVIYNVDQGAVLPGAPERKIAQKFTMNKGEGLIPPIGKFTIELIARYGTNNLPLETTIVFWVLPIKFIATATLITVLAGFVLWRALVSFKK